jgi:hypothetical protein
MCLDQTRRRRSARKKDEGFEAGGPCIGEAPPEGRSSVIAPDDPASNPLKTRSDGMYVRLLGIDMIGWLRSRLALGERRQVGVWDGVVPRIYKEYPAKLD